MLRQETVVRIQAARVPGSAKLGYIISLIVFLGRIGVRVRPPELEVFRYIDDRGQLDPFAGTTGGHILCRKQERVGIEYEAVDFVSEILAEQSQLQIQRVPMKR